MRRTLLIMLVLAISLMPCLAAAHEATGIPHKDLYDLNSHIEEAMIAIAAGDVAKARAEYAHFLREGLAALLALTVAVVLWSRLPAKHTAQINMPANV